MSYAPEQTRLLTTALVTALVALGSGQLHASGFQLMEQNASGLGNAYAGQAAAAEDASTVFFNPAGLTLIRGRQVVGALHGILSGTDFNDEGSTPPQPEAFLGHPGGGDGGDAGDLAIVPNAYSSWELMPNSVWLGVGINVPFGLKTEYDDDWIGRFHAVKSEVKTININPSIAWKVNEMFSVGAGINWQTIDAELTNMFSYRAAALQAGAGAFVPPGSEGLAKLEADDWAWGWNAGVMLNLSPATRLGISYRSSIEYDLEGDVEFRNRPPILTNAIPNGDVEADLEVPDTFSVALSHYFTPKVQFLIDYTWTGWDSIENISIYREDGTELTNLSLHFKNSWRVGAGLNYQVNDLWKLRFGVAYDKTPIRDEFRTPRLPDEDRTWGSIGAQWQMSKQAVLDFGYTYIWVKDASINLPNVDPNPLPDFAAVNAPRGNLVGEYDSDVQLFSVQTRYSF